MITNVEYHGTMGTRTRIEKQRESRADALGYDPSFRPSLSARRMLARMVIGQSYTSGQLAEFSQSGNPQEVVKQALARKYVRKSQHGDQRWFSLTSSGHDFAVKLRASGEHPVPLPTPVRKFEADTRKLEKRKPQRTKWHLFHLGYGPESYLTGPQKALLRAIAADWPGTPRKNTADVLVRCGLAQWVGSELQLTGAGVSAVTKLKGSS